MSRFERTFGNVRRSSVGRWYYGRERSEQLIIACIAALVLVALLWLMFWKPVSDWQVLEANRHQNAQQLLDWMRKNEQAAKQAARSNSQAGQSGRALIPVITRAADAHNLRLNRLQPESNGVISVVLQQQSFNQIIKWVSQLNENNGVSIERASFDGQDAPGYVNAQLRLE